MVSWCELINIPANSTVPNFAWHFLPLTVTLKCIFIIQARRWLLPSGGRETGAWLGAGSPWLDSGARKATQRGCVLQRAEGKKPGHLILGFFSGLTLYIHPQLPMSQGKVETAWHGCKPSSRHRLALCPSLLLQADSICPSHLPSCTLSKQSQYLLWAVCVLPPRKYLFKGLKTWQKLGYTFTGKEKKKR